jgi:hypothetical protein
VKPVASPAILASQFADIGPTNDRKIASDELGARESMPARPPLASYIGDWRAALSQYANVTMSLFCCLALVQSSC